MADLTGGCACGSVRYRLTEEPFDTGWCHCRVCQRVSGAPAMAFTTVHLDRFVIDQGEDSIGTFQSAPFGRRRFCKRCGTSMTIQVDHQPDWIDVAAATLDEPASVRPGFHIFWDSRVPWDGAADDLPRFPKFRPDTYGLEGTEPPA